MTKDLKNYISMISDHKSDCWGLSFCVYLLLLIALYTTPLQCLLKTGERKQKQNIYCYKLKQTSIFNVKSCACKLTWGGKSLRNLHLRLPSESVPPNSKVVKLIPINVEVHLIQLYGTKIVNDLWRVSGVLSVFQFPPSINVIIMK